MREEYVRRLNARRAELARADRADRRFAGARLVLIGVGLALAVGSFWLGVVSPWWLAAPALAFGAAAIGHNVAIDRAATLRASVSFYEQGLLRLDDRWTERPYRQVDVPDDHHLFARDLDLFGHGSLFHRLDTTCTRSGAHTLARWLSASADRDEILARQEAVHELRDRLDSRERLADVGRRVPTSHQIRNLIAWGAAVPALPTTALRWAAIAATLSLVPSALIFWRFGGPVLQLWFDLSVVAAVLLEWTFRARVNDVLEAADEHRRELVALRRVLDELDREPLRAARIADFRAALRQTGVSTSAIRNLDALLHAQEWKRLDLPAGLILFWTWRLIVVPMSYLFWTTHVAIGVERWRARYGHALPAWTDVAGQFDALSALAAYAYEHPDDPFPDIVETGPLFDGTDLRHPLIPAARAVPNSVRLDDAHPLLIVSGSNMSGKSTLLRTVGTNAVLALAGAPVSAARLRLSVLTPGATLRIHDSIQDGTSRFQAEAERLRSIFARAERGEHVLVLLDEFLHGTNSRDRVIAAASLMRAFARKGCIGLITTHDLALTDIADRLSPLARNVHFTDGLAGGEMSFDYRMYPGVATTSNALAVLLKAGLTIDELWTPDDPS